jgi:hypothetical protein
MPGLGQDGMGYPRPGGQPSTIDNCGKTFPVAYCYITAASFKFVADQLSNIAFNNCPEAAVIVGDFPKAWELHAQQKPLLILV